MKQNRKLEVEPHICGQLIFDKGVKAFNGERKFSPSNGVGTTRYYTWKKL